MPRFRRSRLARLTRTARVREAVNAVDAAENRFNWATGVHVDAAVSGYTAADRHLSAVLTDIRPLSVPEELGSPASDERSA